MGTEHFNQHYFSKAMDMKKEDVYLAVELFKQYIDEYPDDYMAKAYYASALITIKKLEEAKSVLDDIETQLSSDRKIAKYKEKNYKNSATIVFTKMKLLFYSNRYEECYRLLNENYDLLLDNNYLINGVTLSCQKKLNKEAFYLIKHDKISYLYKQIADYSYDRFIDHIQKHLSGYNGEEVSRGIFNEDFNLDDVLETIKLSIPSDKALYTGIIEDSYYYKYDSCGKVDNKYTDYFKVIALHDSNEFITMTPSENGKNMPYIDLNYLKNETIVQSRNNQIDKFNKKYAKCLIKNKKMTII